MFDQGGVPSDQLDFLKELENIGAGHAATALASMLGHEVNICVPRAQICPYEQISDILDGPETVVAGLLVGISDDLNGYILLVLKRDDAYELTKTIISQMGCEVDEDGEFNELQISALKELSNILIGSYLSAISSLTGLRIDASVPELVLDMAGAVLNLLVSAYGEYGDNVLFMETEFVESAHSIFGHFFLIPDMDSYNRLMVQMGLA